jgi:hypothetical protein
MDLSRREAAINYFNLRSLREAAEAVGQEPATSGLEALCQAAQMRPGWEQTSKPPLPSPPDEPKLESRRQAMLIKDDRSRRRSQSLDEKRHAAGEYGEAMRIDSVPPLSRESTLPSSFSAAASFAPDSPESNVGGGTLKKQSRGQMQLSHILSAAPAPSSVPNYPAARDGTHSYSHLYSPSSHIDSDDRAAEDRERYLRGTEERSHTSHPGRRMTNPDSARIQESRFDNAVSRDNFPSRPDNAPLEYQSYQRRDPEDGFEAEHRNPRTIDPPLLNGSRPRKEKGRRIRASTLSALNDEGNQFAHREPMPSPNSRHHAEQPRHTWMPHSDHIIKEERDTMSDPRRYTIQGQSQYVPDPSHAPPRGYYERPAESSPPSAYRQYGHSEASYAPYAQHIPQAWPQPDWRQGPPSHRPYETSPQSASDHYPPRYQHPPHHATPRDASPWRQAAVPHHGADYPAYRDGPSPDQQQGAMGPPQHVEHGHGYHSNHAQPPPPGPPHGSPHVPPPAAFPKMAARQVLEGANGSARREDGAPPEWREGVARPRSSPPPAHSPEEEAVAGGAEQGFSAGRTAGHGGYERREA